ncbi:peptidoglycan DD-metalloendopeptidase family protein [Candidatus Gracilibacteria bacterium]|nr:peptidoglycan DD-metalloendopeptidase family protein [Candidatus Gracilibacteria bacterium]MCF7819340.1 peptidoglycan DD-metalloendopeptidase family protein [Candidatus Gracilibacteria bacterium]
MARLLWQSFTEFIRRALHSPFGFQLITLGFLVFFLMSFRPPYFFWEKEAFGEEFFGEKSIEFPISEVGFLDNFAGVRTAGLREVIVEDEDGNLVVKIQPRRRDTTISYTVKSGDNASKIAHKFGIKVSTLLWANDLNVKQTLQVGHKLRIPPTDGVYYTVQQRDTLSEIAKLHNIELSKIYAYNPLGEGSTLRTDQEIFLPEAQKLFVERRLSPIIGAPDISQTQIESIGFRLHRPTKGILTQGYHKGHYALDIGNKLNTPIYAAAGGTVIKSQDGWNYGYGKHIVVDHGNNVETLYAHLNDRKVEVGDVIKTGQLIALMGNSGRVFGPTGIHLHFEIRVRDRKVNPQNYF